MTPAEFDKRGILRGRFEASQDNVCQGLPFYYKKTPADGWELFKGSAFLRFERRTSALFHFGKHKAAPVPSSEFDLTPQVFAHTLPLA
jgi:hypothetical protein